MIRYACDRCGCRLEPNDPGRFIVRIEVFAAVGPVDLDSQAADESGASVKELVDQLANANPDDIEDQTYRRFRFDVCDACRKAVLARPLA